MARYVFYSFHYQNDIFRANVVRNHHVVKREQGQQVGAYDASLWEEAKLKGHGAITKLIDDGLTGCSVTAVLIGQETWDRKYVKYEIQQSWARKKGLIGIYLNNIPDLNKRTAPRGRNPFEQFQIPGLLWGTRSMDTVIPTYDWVYDKGYENLARWIEAAAYAAEQR